MLTCAFIMQFSSRQPSVGIYRCSVPAVSRRHYLAMGILILWLLNSFRAPSLSCCSQSLCVGVTLQMYQLELGIPWSLISCISTNCNAICLQANSYPNQWVKWYTFRRQLEIRLVRKLTTVDSSLGSMASPSMCGFAKFEVPGMRPLLLNKPSVQLEPLVFPKTKCHYCTVGGSLLGQMLLYFLCFIMWSRTTLLFSLRSLHSTFWYWKVSRYPEF